jgi:glycosyltransferase involved in cell wall biosynthesis
MFDGVAPCEDCIGGNFSHAVRKKCMGGSIAASTAVAVETALHRWTRSYAPVSKFIVPSRYLETRLRRAGVFPDRLVHVPNFVDVDTFTPIDDPGEAIVFIGRLAATKGVDLLIDAVSAMGPVRLEVVGNGPDRAALEEQARRLGVDARFHGSLDKPAVAAMMASARLVAVPSVWPENLPLVVIEALASGVPAVVTSMGGAAEMIDDGVDGRVAEPTVESLVSAMTPIVEDSDLAGRMGRAARAKAEAHYAPPQHLEAIMEIYEKARTRS